MKIVLTCRRSDLRQMALATSRAIKENEFSVP
jgi:hypothetical protein